MNRRQNRLLHRTATSAAGGRRYDLRLVGFPRRSF
jgi:hypothetical protein